MMVFGVEIEVVCVAQQADAEESVGVDVEGLDERGLHGLDVVDVLHGDGECLVHDGLHRFALVVERDAGKEHRMRLYRRLNCPAEPVRVDTRVERVEIRQIVANLAVVADALGVDAILGFT